MAKALEITWFVWESDQYLGLKRVEKREDNRRFIKKLPSDLRHADLLEVKHSLVLYSLVALLTGLVAIFVPFVADHLWQVFLTALAVTLFLQVRSTYRFTPKFLKLERMASYESNNQMVRTARLVEDKEAFLKLVQERHALAGYQGEEEWAKSVDELLRLDPTFPLELVPFTAEAVEKVQAMALVRKQEVKQLSKGRLEEENAARQEGARIWLS